MNKYRKLISNTLIFAIGTFSSKVLVFLLMPLYTTVLTDAEYGTVDLMVQVGNFLLPLVSCGIVNGIIRFGLDKYYRKRDVFTTGFLTILGGFVLLLILPVASMARDFDGFRADVPPGWEVMEEKGAMVGFVSPDREAIVTVTVASAQDVDPAAFAAEMARGLGGSDIMEEDGVYSFAFGDNGVTVVHVAGTDLRVISIIGGHPALEGLIDSIEWR